MSRCFTNHRVHGLDGCQLPAGEDTAQHALAIMGWTTTAMLDRYTSWMEQESEEALEAFRGLRP